MLWIKVNNSYLVEIWCFGTFDETLYISSINQRWFSLQSSLRHLSHIKAHNPPSAIPLNYSRIIRFPLRACTQMGVLSRIEHQSVCENGLLSPQICWFYNMRYISRQQIILPHWYLHYTPYMGYFHEGHTISPLASYVLWLSIPAWHSSLCSYANLTSL